MESDFPSMYEQLLTIQKTLKVKKATVQDANAAREAFLIRVVASAHTGITDREVGRRLAIGSGEARVLLEKLAKQGKISERNGQWFPDSVGAA